MLFRSLVPFDAATGEAGREDVRVVFTEERHRMDLGETGLDVRDGLELGSGAGDGGGVALADVLWVEGEVAVRGIEQRGGRARVEEFRCGHFCIGWEGLEGRRMDTFATRGASVLPEESGKMVSYVTEFTSSWRVYTLLSA